MMKYADVGLNHPPSPKASAVIDPTQNTKPKNMNTMRKFAVASLLLTSASVAMASPFWTAAGGTNQNWTQPANWDSFTLPVASSSVRLENALYPGGTNMPLLVNNI